MSGFYSEDDYVRLGVHHRYDEEIIHALRRFPGVGETIAKRALDKFGKEAFEVVLYDPLRLWECQGVGLVTAHKAMSITEKNPYGVWSNRWNLRRGYEGLDRTVAYLEGILTQRSTFSDFESTYAWAIDSGLDLLNLQIESRRFLQSKPSPEYIQHVTFPLYENLMGGSIKWELPFADPGIYLESLSDWKPRLRGRSFTLHLM